VAKPEWGTKRTCPKCGTRFYDLQKDDPATCIDCGNTWTPEPILKTKQPVVVEEAKVAKPKEESDEAEDLNDDDDLDIDDDDDDVLGDVSLDDDDDEEVSGIVAGGMDDDEN